MRTLTTAQDTVLSLPYRANHLRVQIKPVGSSDWYDMTDLEGYDWVEGVTYGSEEDQYVSSATVRLFAQRDHLTLAPLVSISKLNTDYDLTDIGGDIKIEIATIAQDALPQSGDWVEVFLGEIDAVSWAKNPITLQCRDNGAELDRFIETQKKYPEDPNTELEVEDIMQEILDAELGTVTLYSENGESGDEFKSADSPAWITREYLQQKQSVQQALRVLADQIGWQLRYKWNDTDGAFKLHFYDPGRITRARGTITHTGQPSASDSVTVNGVDYDETTDWAIGSTTYDTAVNIAAAINATSGVTSWALQATKAEGALTFSGLPAAGQKFAIGGIDFIADTDWDIGSDVEETIENIVAGFNASSTGDNCLASKRGNATVIFQWKTAGSAGDSIVFTENMNNCTINGGGSLGGSRAGRDVQTIVEWDTAGTAGNSITFTESLDNATIDGGGTLGGTVTGADATVARTFGSSEYYSIDSLTMKRDNVRNKIKVVYGYEKDNRGSVTAEDSSSQTRYGVRYMEVAEAGSSQIDTESEARTFANAILDDLKEPDIIKSVKMPFFWPVEIGDYYTFSANEVHYNADQSLAVKGYQHTLSSNGKAVTVLRCQGKPSSGVRRWLRLEARGGVADQNPDFTYDAPGNVALTPGIGSFEVSFDDPRDRTPSFDDWKFTRVYVDTSSGFTADSTTLHMTAGRVTRFAVTGLAPGTVHYVRLRFEDRLGNASYLSEEQTITTEWSSPYHTLSLASGESITQNPDFSVVTKSGSMPDGWTVALGTFGTDVLVDTTTHKTGGRSIRFDVDPSTTYEIVSTKVPAEKFDTIMANYQVYYTGTLGISPSSFKVGITEYDKDEASLSTTWYTQSTLGMSASTWYPFTTSVQAGNSNTRYVAASFAITTSATVSGVDFYVDRVNSTIAPPQFSAHRTSDQTGITPGGWTGFTSNVETFDHGACHGSGTFQPDKGGRYHISAQIQLSTMNVGDFAQIRFDYSSGTYFYSPMVEVLTGSVAYLAHSIILEMAANDTVILDVWHNKGSNATIASGANVSFWAAKKLGDSEL
jgi:hypothetical protein